MEENFIDYYSVLGISPFSKDSEIRKQFHILAFKWHPDHNSSEEAGEKFREIYEAYDILSHSEKREKYDFEYKKIKEEKLKSFKEKIKFWGSRIFVFIFSLLCGAGSFYMLSLEVIPLLENIIFSSVLSYSVYYLILLLFFDFYKFYKTDRQFSLWNIHTILGINSALIIFFQILYWNKVIFESTISFFLLMFFVAFVFKFMLFTQESFLQFKKGNFNFLIKNFYHTSFIGIIAFLNSLIIALMFLYFMDLSFDKTLILHLGVFGAIEAIIFSSFGD